MQTVQIALKKVTSKLLGCYRGGSRKKPARAIRKTVMRSSRNFHARTFFINSLFLLLISGLAYATTVVRPSDDDLIIGARAIVTGRVLSISTRYDDKRDTVFTYITLQVQEAWKAKITSQQIVLKEPGGVYGDHATLFPGVPEFSVDEQVMVYLDTWPDGSLRVHQYFLGKFSLVEDTASGTTAALRAVAGDNVSVVGRATTGTITDRMEVRAYTEMVRSRIASNQILSAIHETRYYTGIPILAYPPEYIPVGNTESSSIEKFALFATSGSPRWFEADKGQPISFKVNTSPGSNPNLPANARPDQIVADVLDAMNALSNVSGSSLRLIMGGTTGSCGLAGNDGNTISFNNCDGYFSPSSGDAGVLAIGGITRFAAHNPRAINRTAFRAVAEADVSFNPYASSAYGNDHCKLQEVLTHELGHAVGIGHSDDSDATMSSSVHFDGRCAGLRENDQNALRGVYPALGTTTSDPAPARTSLLIPRTLNADPSRIAVCDGTPFGSTRLSWSVDNVETFQIRVDSPTGLVLYEGSESTALTGKVVTNGMSFYLLNAANGAVLASTTLNITTSGCPPPDQHRVATNQAGASFVPGRLLVKFRRETTTSRSRQLIAQVSARDAKEIRGTGIHIVELAQGSDAEAVAKAFRLQPEVAFAELDMLIAPSTTPDDPSYPAQWHLPKIGSPAAWATDTGNSNVIIAILDTGVDPNHPDLAPKLVPGWNVYDNNADTHDVYGHGTQVAGAAAATGNNTMGVASVAWGCDIMPIRISDLAGYASLSTVASGLTWAADHGARVANISYAVSDYSSTASAAQYFQSKGGVVTISAGNDGVFDSSPDNPYVLTVSATTNLDNVATFSNTGNNIDLGAPGTMVYTTCNGSAYGYGSGTSFSAPLVAGVAALVLSANPALTPSQVQDILRQSADDKGPAGWDPGYGSGRLNAANAVAMAGNPPPPPPPDTTAPTVSITSPTNGAAVSGVIQILVTASDNVALSLVSSSANGVFLGGYNTVASPYLFYWDTTTAPNGTCPVTATATDGAGNTVTATVSVNVTNAVVDSTAPTIAITSPTNGARVSGNVSVLVSAADNTAVVKVQLYVDGVLTSTSNSAPFTTKWNTGKAGRGTHTVLCKASDAAGNVGTSTITVTK